MPVVFNFACPLCGRAKELGSQMRVLKEGYDPSRFVLIAQEVRPGPGRGKKLRGMGYGFATLPERSLTMAALAESGEHREFREALAARLLSVLEAALSSGLVAREDVLALARRARRSRGGRKAG